MSRIERHTIIPQKPMTLSPLLIRNHFLHSSDSSRLPKLIYGTAWKREATPHNVIAALQAGFRAIDTAAQPKRYEEALVGIAVSQAVSHGIIKREDVFIQTKFSPPHKQENIGPYDMEVSLEEQIHQSIRSSLSSFTIPGQTPYLDALLLHVPMPDPEDTLRVWRVFEEYYPSRVHNLGLSNMSLAQLQKLYAQATVKPAIVQNRFVRETAYDAVLRQWCREKEIIFQGYRTLCANGVMLSRKPVIELAERLGIERDEAYFSLVLGLGGISVLIGTTTPETMKRDIEGVGKVAAWASQEDGRREWERILDDFKSIVNDSQE